MFFFAPLKILRLLKIIIPSAKVNIAMNCDVESTPTLPLSSFLKNSTNNLPILYIIKDNPVTFPNCFSFFRFVGVVKLSFAFEKRIELRF